MVAKTTAKEKNMAKKLKNKDDNDGPGNDPAALLSLYVKICQSIGLTVKSGDCILSSLKNTESENYGKQIVIYANSNHTANEGSDDSALLGPGRCRALSVAISGRDHGLPLPQDDGQFIAYSLLTDLRIWKSNIGDDGATALADMLQQGGQSLNIAYLELMDCKIEKRGALALGKSLSCAVRKEWCCRTKIKWYVK